MSTIKSKTIPVIDIDGEEFTIEDAEKYVVNKVIDNHVPCLSTALSMINRKRGDAADLRAVLQNRTELQTRFSDIDKEVRDLRTFAADLEHELKVREK